MISDLQFIKIICTNILKSSQDEELLLAWIKYHVKHTEDYNAL